MKHLLSISIFQTSSYFFLLTSLFSILGEQPLHTEYSHSSNHALYIGVIQIVHSENNNAAQLQIKVFADDLLNCMQNAFPAHQFFSEDSILPRHFALVENYFAQHFTCSINQQSSKIALQQHRKEQDTYWLTFEMTCPEEWTTIELSAGFFMELFPSQSNVIQIKNKDQQYFDRVTLDRPTSRFQF